jgi:hypothetical protein
MAELKKLAGKCGTSAKISFSQFEQVLRLTAVGFFTDSNPTDRVRQLIRHIKNPCKAVFGVALHILYEEPSDSLKSSLLRPKSVAEIVHRRDDSSMKIDIDISTALEALKSPRSIVRRSPSGFSGRGSPEFRSNRTPGAKAHLTLREDSLSTRRVLSQPATSRSQAKSFKLNPKSLKLLSEKVELSNLIETERTLKDEGHLSHSSRRPLTRPPKVPPLGISSIGIKENLMTPRQKASVEASMHQIKLKFEAFKSKHYSLVKSTPNPKKLAQAPYWRSVPKLFFRSDFVVRLILRAWHAQVRA